MDKRKVIAAYRRGLISIQECAQIIGVDNIQLANLMSEPQPGLESSRPVRKRSIIS